MKRFFIILIAILSVQLVFSSSEQTFEKANKLYSESKYQDALQEYSKLLKEGFQSEEIYKNMGNCYFKMEDLSKAILFYERGLKINPGNEDISFNLKICNSRIVDKIDKVPEFFLNRWWNQVLNYTNTSNWLIANLIFILAFLITIGIFILSKNYFRKKIWFSFSVVLIILSVFTGITSYSTYHEMQDHSSAIITTAVSEVKSSPDEISKTIFILHQGTKVKVLDKVNDWFEIKIENGNKGWTKGNNFERI